MAIQSTNARIIALTIHSGILTVKTLQSFTDRFNCRLKTWRGARGTSFPHRDESGIEILDGIISRTNVSDKVNVDALFHSSETSNKLSPQCLLTETRVVNVIPQYKYKVFL